MPSMAIFVLYHSDEIKMVYIIAFVAVTSCVAWPQNEIAIIKQPLHLHLVHKPMA